MKIPPAPIRDFIADQTGLTTPAWVKWFRFLTPGISLSGSHSSRPSAANIADGTMFHETDRSSWYFAVDGTWKYVSGCLIGEMTERPADLGSNDAGFIFYTSDLGSLNIWDGSQWRSVALYNPTT